MNSKFLKISIVTTLALTILACATSPTGRKQFLMFSSQQLASSGVQAFDAMKEQQAIARNPRTNNYVECITRAITAQVPDNVIAGRWELVVFDEPQANAFALPGGKMGVYTGLLDVAKNQHQLAAVIGHEVGHVIAQHGNERMSQSTLIGMGQQAVANILNANEVANSAAIMSALGLGVQLGVALPYSRAHESEADLIGLELMARAGFDPRESVALWYNMAELGSSRQPEFMSTHPAPTTRIDELKANMQSALAIYQQQGNKPNCR